MIKGINFLNIGVFDSRGIACPIPPVGDQQKGSWGTERGNLHVVGLVVTAVVDGHAAFANASTKEMGRHLHRRNRNAYALINGCKDKGLGSSS